MTYYLSLGSNLGDREQTLRLALQMIEQRIGLLLRCSHYYYSAPWGFDSPHEFCNLCCSVETTMLPYSVLRETQSIERFLGRSTKSVSGIYHDRPIDIDLIRAFDDSGTEIFINQSLSSGETVSSLTLPHPLWQERDFVKVPLSEILQPL